MMIEGKNILGKREIHNMDYAEIMTHLWNGVGPHEGVSLTDRFTVDALAQMPEHPEWERFPSYFREWIMDEVDEIISEN